MNVIRCFLQNIYKKEIDVFGNELKVKSFNDVKVIKGRWINHRE